MWEYKHTVTRGEHFRPTPDNRPDSDHPDGPIPIPTSRRVGSRFGFPAISGIGLVGIGSGRDENRKTTKKTDKFDRSRPSRYRSDWFRVGSRFGFPAISGIGLVGIGSGRVGTGPMLTPSLVHN